MSWVQQMHQWRTCTWMLWPTLFAQSVLEMSWRHFGVGSRRLLVRQSVYGFWLATLCVGWFVRLWFQFHSQGVFDSTWQPPSNLRLHIGSIFWPYVLPCVPVLTTIRTVELDVCSKLHLSVGHNRASTMVDIVGMGFQIALVTLGCGGLFGSLFHLPG